MLDGYYFTDIRFKSAGRLLIFEDDDPTHLSKKEGNCFYFYFQIKE